MCSHTAGVCANGTGIVLVRSIRRCGCCSLDPVTYIRCPCFIASHNHHHAASGSASSAAATATAGAAAAVDSPYYHLFRRCWPIRTCLVAGCHHISNARAGRCCEARIAVMHVRLRRGGPACRRARYTCPICKRCIVTDDGFLCFLASFDCVSTSCVMCAASNQPLMVAAATHYNVVTSFEGPRRYALSNNHTWTTYQLHAERLRAISSYSQCVCVARQCSCNIVRSQHTEWWWYIIRNSLHDS